MKGRSPGLWQTLVWLTCAAPMVTAMGADRFAAEVFRDENVVVHAGIATQDGQIVHFGDVLSLVVVISWNGENVLIEEPDEQFFSSAWPEGFTPVLMDRQQTREQGAGTFTDELRSVYRFQIVSCPGEEPTCPGNRRYVLPEFALRYRTESGADPVAITFRPEPQTLTVMTTITRDEEDQLYPFSNYFPTGAYPDPLTVTDRTPVSLTAMGIGSLIFLGGMLMWPFRFRRKNPFAAKETPRWQALLLELQNEESKNERRLADRMRRCLVWYCSDVLNLDPFAWLDVVDKERKDEEHEELRLLFMDLLHDPVGRGPELRTRLTTLVADRA